MLEFRRIIDFSSRVHTYMLLTYIFLVILFTLFLFVPVEEVYVNFVLTLFNVVSWLLLVQGGVIIILSILSTIISRVWCLEPMIHTVIRLFFFFILSVLLSAINMIITKGVSYGR